ncbi:MAG: DUF4337 domain-containing protein [Candidatus Eremiobacteraeota bacterium]|nr:DUF4337 domain-containing protein [Candidatus Eremiobacteraeota bacterium]
MLDDFDAHKAVHEAAEHRELAENTHSGGPLHHARLGALCAALLAVAAAIANLLANKSATAALHAKNDAILNRAEASDFYSFYESRGIKRHIYEASLATNPSLSPSVRRNLAAVVTHERTEAEPLLARARGKETETREANERSERLMHAHEVMEGGVALFEIAIALVSISALMSSTFLLAFAGAASIGGFFISAYGFTLQ